MSKKNQFQRIKMFCVRDLLIKDVLFRKRLKHMASYKFRTAKKDYLERVESSIHTHVHSRYSGRMIIINSIAACERREMQP